MRANRRAEQCGHELDVEGTRNARGDAQKKSVVTARRRRFFAFLAQLRYAPLFGLFMTGPALHQLNIDKIEVKLL